VDALYSPRRTLLDKLLVDAAREAGAEVRERFAVDEILLAIITNSCRARLRRSAVELAAAEPGEPPAYAARLAANFEAGVTTRPIRVIVGGEVTVIDLWLDSPAEQPMHCPPALTQVNFHDGHAVRRIVGHYAQRP
jgi:hypothetical protein